MNGISVSAKNLMPTPFAKASLPVCLIGGAIAGNVFGWHFFGDEALRRLKVSHYADSLTRSDAQKYAPVDQL